MILKIVFYIVSFLMGFVFGFMISVTIMADAVYRKRNGLPREDDEFDES